MTFSHRLTLMNTDRSFYVYLSEKLKMSFTILFEVDTPDGSLLVTTRMITSGFCSSTHLESRVGAPSNSSLAMLMPPAMVHCLSPAEFLPNVLYLRNSKNPSCASQNRTHLRFPSGNLLCGHHIDRPALHIPGNIAHPLLDPALHLEICILEPIEHLRVSIP